MFGPVLLGLVTAAFKLKRKCIQTLFQPSIGKMAIKIWGIYQISNTGTSGFFIANNFQRKIYLTKCTFTTSKSQN